MGTPSPFVKLNTDGSSQTNPGKGGIKGVFRNADGEWLLGFFKHYAWISSLMAELQAIRKGLLLAIERGFFNLILETDTIVSIDLLKKNQNKKFSYLLDDCRSMIQKLHQVRIKHIFREGMEWKIIWRSRVVCMKEMIFIFSLNPLLVFEALFYKIIESYIFKDTEDHIDSVVLLLFLIYSPDVVGFQLMSHI